MIQFKCDNCGKTSNRTGDSLPIGWAIVKTTDQPLDDHLCDECTIKHKAFMASQLPQELFVSTNCQFKNNMIYLKMTRPTNANDKWLQHIVTKFNIVLGEFIRKREAEMFGFEDGTLV